MYTERHRQKANFYTELSDQEFAQNKLRRILMIPKVVLSIATFIAEYKKVVKTIDPLVRKRVNSSAVLAYSMWAYCTISGKSLSELQDSKTLEPALLLYVIAVTQDDYYDIAVQNNPTVSVQDAYWNLNSDFNFSEEFAVALQMIHSNTSLSLESKSRIVNLIQTAWTACMEAEKAQVQSRLNSVSLYQIHSWKSSSYGVLGEALTAVLNGESNSNAEIPHAMEMIAFCLAGGMIDSLTDVAEDTGRTASLAISAHAHDQFHGHAHGKTAELLLNYYLRQVNNEEVILSVHLLRQCYKLMVLGTKVTEKLSGKSINPLSYLLDV